ncbi:hypothetical protein [Lacrimispora sp. JR3]|uniref:hypothetical protein n=1 Tax=Lacrimispora sinapis TaxID=3111456 RepID=UPI003747CD52
MTKEDKIYEQLLKHGEPMSAREITDTLYDTKKHQSIVFGSLQKMVAKGRVVRVGAQQPYKYTVNEIKISFETEEIDKKSQMPTKVVAANYRLVSNAIEQRLHDFFGYMQESNIEIYNEFSLQHELGIFLRQQLPDYKVQFERNVSFFCKNAKTIKKEIDIVIYNDKLKERYAIELKHPLNGQYPEQMYAFVKDIKFMEELKAQGFTQNFAIVLVNDRLFYTGSNNSGVYRYFREEKRVYGKIYKPTGVGKMEDYIILDGNYPICWLDLGIQKYYIVSIG